MRLPRLLPPLSLLLVALSPAPAVADDVVDFRTVNTSIAFGTFTPPPGFGAPQPLVFAGTLISTKAQNDASSILDLPGKEGVLEEVLADPIFPGAPSWAKPASSSTRAT